MGPLSPLPPLCSCICSKRQSKYLVKRGVKEKKKDWVFEWDMKKRNKLKVLLMEEVQKPLSFWEAGRTHIAHALAHSSCLLPLQGSWMQCIYTFPSSHNKLEDKRKKLSYLSSLSPPIIHLMNWQPPSDFMYTSICGINGFLPPWMMDSSQEVALLVRCPFQVSETLAICLCLLQKRIWFMGRIQTIKCQWITSNVLPDRRYMCLSFPNSPWSYIHNLQVDANNVVHTLDNMYSLLLIIKLTTYCLSTTYSLWLNLVSD